MVGGVNDLADMKATERIKCPLCGQPVDGVLRHHLISIHGEEGFRRAVLSDKELGMSDVEIGRRYGISFGALQRIVIQARGANVNAIRPSKQIKQWQPRNFHLETTTVWSFKERGSWATHDGRYRGNWSPYIPRNVILRYSKPGDLVLDYFVGGGTTAVEAKLLGRRCIARDINPAAIALTRENLDFSPPSGILGEEIYEPIVEIGDARNLADIPDGSVDLICAHPPYAGIIRYSSGIPGDLSALSVPEFLKEMGRVARESLRVLKPGGKCAILVGDARKSRYVVPIGFMVIRVFLDTGFRLNEMVIKRQHNCKTTGFWYTRSIQYNFLLLAHEYLPVFEKPVNSVIVREQAPLWGPSIPYRAVLEKVHWVEKENLQTMTVWVFPDACLESEVRRNLLRRFAGDEDEFVDIRLGSNEESSDTLVLPARAVRLLWIRAPREANENCFASYRRIVREIALQSASLLVPGGYLAIEARDLRSHSGDLIPAALLLWEDLTKQKQLALKEIVVVVPEEPPLSDRGTNLEIVHKYLLIYRREK